MQDECHLVWGDVCGYAWGPRGEAIEVPLGNPKQRQTYYGALNLITGQTHLKEFDAGNGENTLAYLQWLRKQHEGKRLLVLWDGASYHRDRRVQEFLEQLNTGLEPHEWPLTLMLFAPNAPDQNPIEDVWLAGKNHLRQTFAQNPTFAAVRRAFGHFLQGFVFQSAKFDWYAPSLHPI